MKKKVSDSEGNMKKSLEAIGRSLYDENGRSHF
jgi:hypothetical protein